MFLSYQYIVELDYSVGTSAISCKFKAPAHKFILVQAYVMERLMDLFQLIIS